MAAVEGTATSIALALPFEVASARQARHRLAADLRSAGIPGERVEDALVVLSELVGNALRHARPLPSGMVRVAWMRMPQRLEITVTDGGGPTHPRELDLPVSALGGRGLTIVGELTETWGVRQDNDATTVYAVVSLDHTDS